MPVVSLKEIVDRAFAERYGVPAINVVNDLTMEAVLAAAVQERSPVIIQTSVKTVRSIGLDLLFAMWREMTAGIEVPVSLHLDHCPDRAVISACLRKGWNSVLFDASSLPVEENQRQTIEVVAEARSYGAHVEGRDRGDHRGGRRHRLGRGCRNPVASGGDRVHRGRPGSTCSPRRSATRTASTAPSPSSTRSASPTSSRHEPVPIALHGGTGMTDAQFTDLIARGCAKVNISTALKVSYMQANLDFLRGAEERNSWDPPSLFSAVRAAVLDLAADHMRKFGSVGKAW